MIKTIELDIETVKGMEKKEVRISSLRVRHYGAVSSIIGGLLSRIKEDEGLMQTIQTQFFGNFKDDWKDQDTGTLLESAKAEIQGNTFGSIAFALQHLPTEFINLVSVVSDLPIEVVNNLDEEGFLKVVEAVVDVNDLNRLQELGKKHFDSLKTKIQKQISSQQQQTNLKSVTQ